ncbi:putative glycoside hydrolase [Desulfuribacillus alkaliarsenatis]|nr:putative glycoside hydrolase [Desulfuribacillus alkaliarsenatis]
MLGKFITLLIFSSILGLGAINTEGLGTGYDESLYSLMTPDYQQHYYLTATPADLYKHGVPRKVRGIYLSGGSVGSEERLNKYINLARETEINSFVIDVKDDNGKMTYASEVPIVKEVEANKSVRIKDIRGLLYQLQREQIYPIARIVVFKDPYLPGVRQDLAIKRKDGQIWRDPGGVMWVDPHNKEVWEYSIEIAKEAAKYGFREIQFDYVRFPENGRLIDQQASFPNKNGRSKAEVIEEFLIYAREQLDPYNVFISADVFGLTTSVQDDMNIGQDWNKISSVVDYICPMIYPSHYGPGNYGLANPNAQPYQTVSRALKDAITKNRSLEEAGKIPAIVRPWLQDFTMGGVIYGPEEVVAQIKAGEELGIDEYIMWNAANRYNEKAWRELRRR